MKNKSLTKESGVFTLHLPTGAGKTQGSLRYAVNNAKKFKKKHIFYVTAFLSVLEQNAEDIRNTLKIDEQAILEHHSNIANGKSENELEDIDYIYGQYLTDSWDAPVIMTTMVQFFNTLFKGKSSNLRRFSQLANSVIIIDEPQSIPIENIYLFNLMMNYLSRAMNTTIILCTATQPLYDLKELDYRLQYDEDPILVELTTEEKNIFERVQPINLIIDRNKGYSSEELFEEINIDLTQFNSILIILNTKKAVKAIYDMFQTYSGVELYYLTTNLSSAHRLNKIHRIKKQLEDRKHKIVVIATQLVEAGVNFDFDVVYRSVSGVDSLIQAAGRCNRNGRLDKGIFKVFNYEDENTKSIEAISKAREATFSAMRTNEIVEKGQIFDLEKQIDPYYKKLFNNHKKRMGYQFHIDRQNRPTTLEQQAKDTLNLVDLLGFNKEKRQLSNDYFSKALMQDFALASNVHALIKESTISVIVHWTNPDNPEESSEDLITQLRQSVDDYDASQVKATLKKLQKFTISVHNIGKLEMFVETLEFFSESIYILFAENYDEQIDLDIEELQLLSY